MGRSHRPGRWVALVLMVVCACAPATTQAATNKPAAAHCAAHKHPAAHGKTRHKSKHKPVKHHARADAAAHRRHAAKRKPGHRKPAKKKTPACPVKKKPAAPVTPTTTTPVGTTTTAPASGGTPAPTPGPAPEALARLRVAAAESAATLDGARGATAALLQSAGIGVPGDDGSTPAGGLRIDATGLVLMAQDAQARAGGGRVTLLDLAELLDGAGVGIAPDTTSTPPAQNTFPGTTVGKLEQLLAAWLAFARAHPDDPDTQPIFVLQALAQSQTPAIDLATPDYDPDALQLSNVDLAVLASGIAQFAPVFRGDEPAPRSARSARESSTPCTDFKNILENAIPLAGGTWGYAVGKVGTAALQEEAGAIVSMLQQTYDASTQGAVAAEFGNLLSGLGLVMKAQALAELYSYATATLTAANDQITQPGPQDGDVTDDITVVAGVDDRVWQDFQAASERTQRIQAFKDCASLLGMPTPTTVADIGGAVTSWRAAWQLSGSPHAEISLAYNTFDGGIFRKRLTQRNDHQGQSTLTVDAVHETRVPDASDQLVPEPATVTAKVQTDAPPNLASFLGVVDGALGDPFGLASSVGDILMRMFQALDTFDASTTITVMHHAPAAGRWTGTITFRHTYAYQDHSESAGHSSSDPNLEFHNESAETTREQIGSQITVDGQTAETGYPGGDARGWTLSGRGMTGYASSDHSTTHQDGTGIGHLQITGYTYCHYTKTNDGTRESHGKAGSGQAPVTVSVSVNRNGTWEASGSFPSVDVDTLMTEHDVAIADPEGDDCTNGDTTNSIPGTDTVSGSNFDVQGTFDPSNPPSALSGTAKVDGDFTHEQTTVRLNYNAPVLGPPAPDTSPGSDGSGP